MIRPAKELERALFSRNAPGVYEKVKAAKVAIAGLGGLGSNIAVMLARTGVGHLFLVDFDVVEPSNLNRQVYTTRHLGLPKTEALRGILEEINPFAIIETQTVKIAASNVVGLFKGYDIVCEAFDDPRSKAILVNTLLEALPKVKLVCGSGMAGYSSANLIQTSRRMKNLYVCGDLSNEATPENGVMAPRVSVCAGHQAHMILRLLLGAEEV